MSESEFGYDHLDAVDHNADDEWKACVDNCIQTLVDRSYVSYFTADDVNELMAERFPLVSTHERRAMGPRFLAAKKSGVIIEAGNWVRSNREVAHGRKLTVWTSADGDTLLAEAMGAEPDTTLPPRSAMHRDTPPGSRLEIANAYAVGRLVDGQALQAITVAHEAMREANKEGGDEFVDAYQIRERLLNALTEDNNDGCIEADNGGCTVHDEPCELEPQEDNDVS
jgi:hypothetical protein